MTPLVQFWPVYGPNSTKFLEAVGDPSYTFQRPCPLSMSRFVQEIIAMNSRSRRKPNKCKKIFGPQYFWEGQPRLFYGRLLRDLLSTVWHSLVEFRLMISVCKALQWIRMQNLRKAHNLRKCKSNFKPFMYQSSCRLRRCSKPLLVANALARLCMSYFIPKI